MPDQKHWHKPDVLVGVVGAVIALVGMSLPWLELLDKRVNGWALLRVDPEIESRVEAAQAKIDQNRNRLKQLRDAVEQRPRPLADPTEIEERRPRIAERLDQVKQNRPRLSARGDKLEERRDQVAEQIDDRATQLASRVEGRRNEIQQTVATIQQYLFYVQVAVFIFLIVVICQFVRAAVSQSLVYGTLSFVSGLVGLIMGGTLVVLWMAVSDIQVLGTDIPLQTGYGLSATAGLTMAAGGLWWAVGSNWKVWLPLQLVPAVGWCVYLHSQLS